jgi:hypothetical protein
MNHLQNVAGTQNFKVYLEGIQIPFSTFRILESEHSRPKASLSIPASEEALNLLSNTMVHFFGNDPLTGESILLFEGYITGVSYQKSEGGSFAIYECAHILQLMEDITLWPTDAVMPYHFARESGLDPTAPPPRTKISEVQVTGGGVRWDSSQAATLEELASGASQASTRRTEAVTEVLNTPKESIPGFMKWGNFYPQILEQLQTNKRNLQPVYNRILREFLSRDLFYAALNIPLQLTKTSYVLINPDVIDASIDYVIAAQFELLTSTIGNIQAGPVYLKDALSTLNSIVGNRTITPASPTFVETAWPLGVANSPIREVTGPTYYPTAPARCNVFFQDDINSLQYARTFYGEPTRMTVSAELPEMYITPNAGAGDPKQIIFATFPGSGGSGYAKLSQEEAYKGVFPSFATVPIQKLYKAAERAPASGEVRQSAGRSQHYLKVHARTKFLDAKYSQRSCSFSAVWNPYRHIGLPATVVDPENLTIYGILSGVSTTFDAAGSAVSQISFSAPRILNLKNLEDPKTYLAANSEYYELIPEPDSILLKPERFSADVVGHRSYTRLIAGSENNTDIERAEEDYSIVKYCRIEGKVPTLPTEWAGKKSAYYVLQGVNQLIKKAADEKQRNPAGFYKWMLQETKRKIITEKDYWAFTKTDFSVLDASLWEGVRIDRSASGSVPRNVRAPGTEETAPDPALPGARLFHRHRHDRVKTLKDIYSRSGSETNSQDGFPHFVNMRAKNVS